MRRFRIYLWRDGGFWNKPVYLIASSSRVVRTALESEHGREVAQKSCVTAYADRDRTLHPKFEGTR